LVARFILLLTLFFAAPALAAGDGGRADFERANKYFEAGEHEAALPFFERAYTDSGNRPSTIRALAQCERSLKLYDKAIEHFQEYLATHPPEEAQILETLSILHDLRDRQRAATKPTTASPSPAPTPSEAPNPPGALAPSSATSWTADPVVAASPPPKDEDVSPILWIAIGGAAVLGGALILGVALSGPRAPEGGTRDTVLFR